MFIIPVPYLSQYVITVNGLVLMLFIKILSLHSESFNIVRGNNYDGDTF